MMITNYEDTGLEKFGIWIEQNGIDFDLLGEETLREMLKTINVSFVAEGINRLQSTLLCELKDSYVQQSQRYVSMKTDGYTLPDLDQQDQEKAQELIERIFSLYNEMSKLKEGEFKGRPRIENYYYGIPIEDARYILPLAIKTNITVAMSGDKLINLYQLITDQRYQNHFGQFKVELERLLPAQVVNLVKQVPTKLVNTQLVESYYQQDLEKITPEKPIVFLNGFNNLDLKVGLGALTSTSGSGPSEVLAKWGEEALEKAQGVTKRVLGYGHHSIAELGRTTFGMMCSLVTYHQQVRHRLSANYRENLNNLINDQERPCVVPPTIQQSEFAKPYLELVNEVKEFRKYLQGKYEDHQELAFLLNCDQLKIIMGTNARMDIGMLAERTCFNAQWEIRELSMKKLHRLRDISPVLYEQALPSCAKGPCREGKLSCGRAAEVRAIFNKG